MDRAVEYIEEQYAEGATTLLIVTHHDVGRGMLQRLTGSDDEFSLDNAAAYSVLKRRPDEMRWRLESLNEEP
jgi:broad specificity phosphatase PhoE